MKLHGATALIITNGSRSTAGNYTRIYWRGSHFEISLHMHVMHVQGLLTGW